jgi:XTP/dITP diphosphohydrolase
MKIVFATNNLNKIKEVQSLLPSNITIVSLASIGCNEEIPETKNTIRENAIQKADYINKRYGYDCFADDTGLNVNALNGSPGVRSARYAGPEKCSESNMKLLLSELKLISDRSAQFKTVIALNINGKSLTFEGICKGEITHNKKEQEDLVMILYLNQMMIKKLLQSFLWTGKMKLDTVEKQLQNWLII